MFGIATKVKLSCDNSKFIATILENIRLLKSANRLVY